ncbi:AFG1-like ATPase-domain-containing protein [Dipodascopsis tothii]|uniref:AFG1-like ATPase-domain-containing protein n=1 Tax=Dipodascopsis tothii TaxID=44089 RepID=UPI0034CF147B
MRTAFARAQRPAARQLRAAALGTQGTARRTLGPVGARRQLRTAAVCRLEGPTERYNTLTREGKLRDDEFQRGVVTRLQTLHEELQKYVPEDVPVPEVGDLKPKKGFWGLFQSAPVQISPQEAAQKAHVPLGIYLWGDVGCGKTMLMNMFYSTLEPSPPSLLTKKRIHFHAFMQDVHKRAHALKVQHGAELDAIPLLASELAREARVFCFDEFQVIDVADAMLLRRLMESLVSYGVVFLITSNRAPDDLYKNGIQRQSFVPCIQLLKDRCHVICLDSPTDYRRISRPISNVYYSPLDAGAKDHAEKWFEYFADPKDPPHPASHTIWGREVRVPKASGKVAQFSFSDLFDHPLSAADYLELARQYTAFVVTDIPVMTIRSKDIARRFITFIDSIYESKGRLVATSAAPFANLFVDDDPMAAKKPADGAAPGHVDDELRAMMDNLGLSSDSLKSLSGDEERFAFARALSRLQQMSSTNWLEGEE